MNSLEKRFARNDSNLIVQEFGCESARVDVAVVNGALHGYEIKSDQDTLTRLTTQVPAYGRIFNHMTLVIGSRHKPHLLESLPHWWTIMVAGFSSRGVTIKTVRKGQKNPSTSIHSIVRLMWSSEASSLLRRRGFTVPKTWRADDMWNSLVEKLEPEDLSLEVRNALRSRARSRFVASQIRRDDSCTTVSSARLLRHSQNRQWLALQSARPRS